MRFKYNVDCALVARRERAPLQSLDVEVMCNFYRSHLRVKDMTREEDLAKMTPCKYAEYSQQYSELIDESSQKLGERFGAVG